MPTLLESLDRKDYGGRNTKGPKANQGRRRRRGKVVRK